MASHAVSSGQKPHVVCVPFPGARCPACVIFWTTSACGFLAYLYYHLCVGKGLCPLKGTYVHENDLNTEIEWIPTIRNPRVRDLPSFIRTTNPNDIMLNYLSRE
ncbi:BnaC05g50480D [Brassica napus]|uniref:BnaC05g50480D protein n=1 Tax=Brassica napus TaxID=3708 RepID=A0A078JQC1_BRANA|nr:BnaC05g50480D [Brassica napus]